jgi:hypothetical protein
MGIVFFTLFNNTRKIIGFLNIGTGTLACAGNWRGKVWSLK